MNEHDQSEARRTQPLMAGTNGQVELPADIFDREASIALMHQVVNAQLAAKRQGTHSTKTTW